MSHDLTATDHMVSGSNVTPWHGLGTVLPGHLSAAEALEAARLNWRVEQEPVYDGDMTEIPSYQLNRRSDTREVLGVVAKGWQPVQNDRLLEIAEALVQVDDCDFRPVIETAGSLRGGRIVWAMVKIGAREFVDSAHHTYLLLSNGHTDKRALRGTLTDVRVVCANTLGFAEASASQLFVTHARGVDARLNTALETLGWANAATRATFVIYDALAKAPVAEEKARDTFRSLVAGNAESLTKAQTETLDEMTELFRGGRGNAGRSAFGVLNAVTDWADHRKGYRQNDGWLERRFIDSTLGGKAQLMKADAFRAAKQLAGV